MATKPSGIDEILGRWRDEVKRKQRRIISFEETVELKIKGLRPWIYPETAPLEGWEVREFTYTRHREREYLGDWRPIKVGESWGGPDRSALFRCAGQMPTEFAGKPVALKIYVGGDGLLSLNGQPYHGLDPFRDTAQLTPQATGDERYAFEIEAYIFWHFGESEIKTFEASHFAVWDQEMHDTYWDFRAAYNVMVIPDLDPDLHAFLKAGMAAAIVPLDQNETNPMVVRMAAREARRILRERIYATDRFKQAGLIHLCGNSHLDVVFLWTHAEFVRKLGRTHATALRLLDQYPDYIFSQSQPLMYEEMRQTYPTMFEEVKRQVQAGRWEVIGAFWVEPDCNLIAGESFVRQILHGVRYSEREFGVTPRTCWCPDVFGNAWTMPQILVRSGLKYFVTHKMVVWNDTNPWRKHTFWWQGPDGSQILSLVPPTHFIGTIEPDHMATHWDNFADKATIGESLYNFGWGDGGGGPDVEMLEYQKRYGDFPGVVPAKPNTIEGALASIEGRAQDAALPIVNDELYLEEHRGVHTTKARLKKLNRRCEYLFRRAELWSCFAQDPYPRHTLESGWKGILTNQFHDSLPGSHITPVYADLLEAYGQVTEAGEMIVENATLDIAERIATDGEGEALVLFNGQPFVRDTLIAISTPERPVRVYDPDGREVPCQFITHYETGGATLIFPALGLPPVGYAVFRLVDGQASPLDFPGAPQVTARTLENDFLRVALNDAGELTSLVDKTCGKELIDPAKRGNVLHLYEDIPGKYEAWDIAPSYTKVEFDLGTPTIEVVEAGPVRAAIQITRHFRASRMIQRVVLTRDARRVDFETWVDWHEQQKLLKVRFHTNVTTRTAAYDIPFGVIERSCYRNNSYDEARFEVPAHAWMDLSQPDRGLSLLNDCKYGHEAFGQMIALTLLRGPLNPDPTSDQEEHWFTYSLYPHAGTWREAQTHRQALDLNDPVVVVRTGAHDGSLPAVGSFLQLDGTPVTLEALKRAEDSEALIIRLVERHGASGPVTVTLPAPIVEATECNLLEREDEPVAHAGQALSFTIDPFQIRTFKVGL
jgi:alpha-mannosidase